MSFDTVRSLLAALESNLSQLETEPAVRRRVFRVAVECAQNVAHHSEQIEGQPKSSVRVTSHHNGYTIQTCNTVSSRNVEKIKAAIDHINTQKHDQLNTSYQATLVDSKFSPKGTAGLGWLAIARRSAQKIDYHFEKITDQHSRFTFTTFVLQKGKVNVVSANTPNA